MADAELAKKTIEEQIEEERAALKSDGLTPVTKESFFAWKERRRAKRQADLEEEMKKAELEKAMGKKKQGGKNSVLNGRALFTFNPDLFKDGDDETGADTSKAASSDQAPGKDEEEKQADDGQIQEQPAEVDESLFQGQDAEEDVDFD